MIIVMRAHAPKEQAEKIVIEMEKQGFQPVPMYGVERTVIALIGDERKISTGHIESLPGVEKVMMVLQPYKLVSKETKSEPTIIEINGTRIGDPTQVVAIAGPCSIESPEQMHSVASDLSKLGVHLLRAGAYKPRTGPYNFQGLGKEGLDILEEVGKKYNMATVTEVLDIRDLEYVCTKADMIQIGARNMQNFELLKELGRIKKPVLLKRGLCATIEELLLAAEYILSNGNGNVILCERGIRTFEKETRNTLALATIPLVKELSHLPIIADPSHGTGKYSLIEPMTKAAIACGADGFIVEVHPDPKQALSDAQQQLTPADFATLLDNSRKIADALNKKLT